MSNDLNNIDNLFKAGLGNYSEVPPPDVWDALEQRLDNEKKKRPFAWRWFFVTVAVVMVAGSLFAWRITGGQAEIVSAMRGEGTLTSVQQSGAASCASAVAGNTSAAQPATPATNNTKHHKKHNSDNNTTNTNTVVVNTTTTNSYPATTPANAPVIDNNAMAMAETDGRPGAKRNAAKEAAMQQIINNRHQNNIAVTESTFEGRATAAPVNTMYATAEEEEELTYSRPEKAHKHELSEDDNLIVAAPKKHKTAQPTSTTTGGYAVNSKRNNNNIYASAARTTAPATTRKNGNSYSNTSSNSSNNNVTAAATPITAVRITTPVDGSTPATTGKRKQSGTNVAAATTPVATAVAQASGAIPTTRTSAKPANNATATTTKTNKVATQTTTKATTSPATTGTAVTKPAVAAATPAKQATAATTNAGTTRKTALATTPATTKTASATTTKRTKHAAQAKALAAAVTTPAAKAVAAKVTAKNTTATTPVTTQTAAEPTAVAGTTPSRKKTKTVATSNVVAAAPGTKTQTPATVLRTKKGTATRTKTATTNTAATTAVAVNTPATNAKNRNNKNNKNNNKPVVEPPVLAATTPAITPKPDTAKTVVATPPIPGTFKPDTATKTQPITATPPPAATDSAPAGRHHYGFTYGVKGGFEGGFGNSNASKFVIAPFIERQLTSKLSVMAQPAVKFAGARSNALSGTQTYYNADPNGSIVAIDSVLVPVIQNNQTTGYLVRINMAYSQKYDSIVKSYATGGNYVEFELPVMLKYGFNDKLSVYGGVTLSYSKYVAIKENTVTVRNLTKYDTSFTIYPSGPLPFSQVMNYTGNAISTYNGPLYPTQTGGLFRMGYMLGFSYQLQKRWMVDVLMQQGKAKANVQGGYNVNKPLSTPYFRVTLGYRLSK